MNIESEYIQLEIGEAFIRCFDIVKIVPRVLGHS